MKIMVTGNRNTDEEYVKQEFTKLLNEIDILIVGGAIRTDMICAEIAIQNNIPVTMYIPFLNHTKLWNQEDINRFNAIKCEKKIISKESNNYSKLYRIRNQKMVEDCDLGIVFWNGKSSGTSMTMRMLEKANKLKYVFHTNLHIKQEYNIKPETENLENFF